MYRRLFVVFILLGLISLTADMVYEGARSTSGAFLEYLEAPPAASAVIGIGEFTGYIARFVSGLLAARIGSSMGLWIIIASGYALGVLTIPLLSLIDMWVVVVFIYILERIGKGLRAPVRDVLLAEVTEGIGRGKGFGLHELMDQIGALTGPLLFAIVLMHHGYRGAFTTLLIPGVITMTLVFLTWSLYPRVRYIEISAKKASVRGLDGEFWLYVFSMVFQVLGFVHWAIISYFLRHWGILGDVEIALLYVTAMGVDALVALPMGMLYDRFRFKSLYLAPVSTLMVLYTFIARNPVLVYFTAISWGLTMSISETLTRASIADILDREKLAIAYGVFGLIYGIALMISGFVITHMIQYSVINAIAYVTVTQTTSVILLLKLNESIEKKTLKHDEIESSPLSQS